MTETIYTKALGIVEDGLKTQNISISRVTGLTVNVITESTELGDNVLSPGKYCFVDMTVVVPIL
ncbi:MAG: hypothetical protein HQL06_15415 [Nitrospirae bacterium]|nr:hypothetical protein [Nitrospirota bacterium]